MHGFSATDCFVKSEEKAGSPTANSVSFSDADTLAPFYTPGMEVKAFVACYDEDVKPKKLVSLRPLIGYEGGDEFYTPLTQMGPHGGVCEMWLGRGSYDSMWKLWLP